MISSWPTVQTRCPSCHPVNSVRTLKETQTTEYALLRPFFIHHQTPLYTRSSKPVFHVKFSASSDYEAYLCEYRLVIIIVFVIFSHLQQRVFAGMCFEVGSFVPFVLSLVLVFLLEVSYSVVSRRGTLQCIGARLALHIQHCLHSKHRQVTVYRRFKNKRH